MRNHGPNQGVPRTWNNVERQMGQPVKKRMRNNVESVLSMTPWSEGRWEQEEPERMKRIRQFKNHEIAKTKNKTQTLEELPNRSPQGQGYHSSMSTNYTNRIKQSAANLAKALPSIKADNEQKQKKKKEEIEKFNVEIRSTEQKIRDLESEIKTLEQPQARSFLSFIRSPFSSQVPPGDLDRLRKRLEDDREYLKLLKRSRDNVEHS